MKLTIPVLRGLHLLTRLGMADIQCSEPKDFTRVQRREAALARAWVLSNHDAMITPTRSPLK